MSNDFTVEFNGDSLCKLAALEKSSEAILKVDGSSASLIINERSIKGTVTNNALKEPMLFLIVLKCIHLNASIYRIALNKGKLHLTATNFIIK